MLRNLHAQGTTWVLDELVRTEYFVVPLIAAP